MATAKTISIQELFNGGYKFIIKPYQRGYRWEQKQIDYLIRDISTINRGQEYCLQPVIVVPTGNENEYELVDGQQRLTTLWILKELYASTQSLFRDSNAAANYSLSYENKYPLQTILENLNKALSDKDFIEKTACDMHDLYDALASELKTDSAGNTCSFSKNMHPDVDSVIENITSISKYSADVSDIGRQNIYYFLENIFRAQDGFRRSDNIKVIWYELEPDKPHEAPITIFTNVNANKIKLTNAELIKARLMYEINNGAGHISSTEFALEWEFIERQLNDDNFWYFIHGKAGYYATRIDFLFEVYFSYKGINRENKNNEFWAYDEIDRMLETDPGAMMQIWQELRKIFYTLQDWYNDDSNEIYHLLGLITSINTKQNSAKRIAEYYRRIFSDGKNKTQALDMFKDDIIKSIYDVNLSFYEKMLVDWLNGLDYNKHKEMIKNVLLAYSIASLVNSKNNYERFPFDLYNTDNYDIEHINPRSKHSDDRNAKHIGNLVLLDSNTNRSEEYKTASYGEKRNCIIRILRHGDRSEEKNNVKYIPIGTRWVFLEAFEDIDSNNVSLSWDKHDEYIKDIAKNLVEMLGERYPAESDMEDDESEQ